MQSPEELARHLEEDELLRRDPRDGALRTTRRFQGAMMRAFARVLSTGSDDAWGDDLRIPLASALLELYEDASDATIAALVAIMLPIESRELSLTRSSGAGASP